MAQEKAEAELGIAPALLQMLCVRSRVVTGDALYCHHALCQQIRAQGGQYLFVIKLNQPELLEEVALLFDQPPPGESFTTASSQRTWRGRHEVHTLTASAALVDYLGELGIENRLHYVRDVTLGEDASQVRSAAAPQVLAALRNAILGLLRQHG